jgi:signal transduction histidine kinase
MCFTTFFYIKAITFNIMIRINSFIDLFIPNQLKHDPYIYRKSLALTYLHLFLLVATILIYLLCFFLNLENDPNLLLGCSFSIFFIIIFKKYGNLLLSSHLFASLWFIILGVSVPNSGGIHSDNLLWLIISPLIALLFGSKKAGFFWLAVLFCFVIAIYFIDINEMNINKVKPMTISYFMNSYILLFLVIYGVVIIFEHGQTLIINMLEAQKKELQAQKLALEQKNQEILEQKRQLEKMGQKLKDTNFALEHFAATAAHDLKEPLRMISMYTSLAERRLVQYPDRIRDEYMGYVTNGALRMDKLLTNLLQFSRSGRNEEDVKNVDLNTTLYHVILNLTVVLKDTGASIISANLPNLHASESEMSQLFQNLIANAIKFRKDNVPSEVTVTYIERKDTHVICIKDNGIGIKKEHQSKVFTIFQRLNDRSKYDGSGIGLATCRRIVDNLNGKIWLRSTEGEGSSFYMAFPKSQTQKYILIQEEELEFA